MYCNEEENIHHCLSLVSLEVIPVSEAEGLLLEMKVAY